MAAAVVFAPVLVAKSPLRHRILPMLLPEYPAKITTGRCSMLWWSKVELGDVQLDDLEGEPMLLIDQITSEKSLASLLADRVRVGGFLVHRPHLTVRIREAGSNLEEALAPIFAAEDSDGLDCAFHVREGRVEIVDAAGRTTQMESFEADIRLPLDSAEAITVRGKFEVQNAGAIGKAGTIDFDVSHRSLTDENNAPSQSGTLRLKTGDLKMEALAGLFGRFGSNLEITGVVVSDLAAEWTLEESLTFKVQGGLNATGFRLDAPEYLGRDTFQLEYLTHKGQIEYHAGDVHLRDWELTSDVLGCQADGQLNLSQILNAWNNPSTEIPLEEFHLAGEVDIARIAKMLPQTLRLREGLEIQTGKMQVALDAELKNTEQHLAGKITTSKIAATADGRAITWEAPLELNLKARNTTAGPVLDELNCKSDFLTLWAQGTPDNATVKAACQLDSLMAEVNRFADLDDYRLAGRLDAGLTLRRLSPELFRGAGSAIIKNFEFRRLADPNASPWTETQLILAAGGDLVSKPEGPRELHNLSLRITAGGDELELSQTDPVPWMGGRPEIAMLAEIRGELGTWQNRLKPIFSPADLRLAGHVMATAKLKLSQNRIALERAVADFQSLRLQGAGVNLSESRVHLETHAEWDADVQKLRLPTTTWASPSLSLRADDLEYFTTPEGKPRTSGRVVFRGGVAELSRWFSLEKAFGPDLALTGTASGQIDLTMLDQAADANWNLIIENGTLSRHRMIEPPPGPGFPPITRSPERETVWSEQRIAFRGGGVYRFAQDHLELRPTLLEAPWLYVTANGTLQDLSTTGTANLTGTVTCNLALLAERYRTKLGETFQITGHETRAFLLRGPIWGAGENERIANELTAAVSVPWQKIDAFGFLVGAGELRADLNLGTLQLGPVDVPFSTGRMRLKSQLPLNAPVLALQIEKGPVLENVRLTPEISRKWIKYAVPLLADTTESEGQFSLSLTTDGIIPLENPSAMNASGVLAIESAQMRPGKLANAFLDVVKQVKTVVRGQAAGGVIPADQTLVRLEKQSVNLQCAGGRIYHQNLKMVLADVPVTTSGSVGWDETLSLTAELPIPDDWLIDNRLLQGLKGQTLRIPVTGTLSQPVLDTRAIFTALQKAAQNATGRLIDVELQNQLDRLFKRR